MKKNLYILIFGLVLFSCESSRLEPLVDCSINPTELTLVTKSDANCGQSNGSVELSASGGSGPYQFFVENSAKQSSSSFEGLAAGQYSFFAEDTEGCQAVIQVSIENADGVSIASASVEEAGCSSGNGSITIAAVNGVEPYSYQLDGGSFQPENLFTDIQTGTYEITVKDSQGCEFSQQVEVGSGVSYANNIAPIIANNCSVTGCHNGSRFPDFRSFQNIQSNASRIMSRTQNGSMPVGRTLTQQEIDMIACWVNDGAKDN